MLRGLGLTLLLAVALGVAGCSGNSGEIPAKTTAEPKMNAQQSAEKALQGMPPEMKAKMGPQMQQMMKNQKKP